MPIVKSPHFSLIVLAFGAALAAGSARAEPALAPQPVTPVTLAAHRAVYDLTLGDEQGTQAPADANGLIAFEFKGSSCEGYNLDFRQVLELQPGEGDRRVSDTRSSTYESGDGDNFRFKTETRVMGADSTSVVGSAKKTADQLAISLSIPDRSTVDVDRRVTFPTEQMALLIEAARQGKRTLAMKLFDGSDTGKKIYNTLAVIGQASAKPPTDPAAQSEPLRSMRRWPVSVSYFQEGKEEISPEYVLSFDLYENGVSGSLRLNYGDFTVNGALSHFELLPQKSC
jgi:hypothetical protein